MGDDLKELIVAMYEREADHAFHITEIVDKLPKDMRVSRQRVEQLHKRLVEGSSGLPTSLRCIRFKTGLLSAARVLLFGDIPQ